MSGYKHGMCGTPEYGCWKAMIRRCHSPNSKDFPGYGGRHPTPITVCEAWREDFMAFYRDVGPRPGPAYSLDRINNEQGYSPGNVRWATMKEQNRNRRDNTYLVFEGESQILTDVAGKLGINCSTLSERIKNGTPLDQSLQIQRPVQSGERFGSLVTKQPSEPRTSARQMIWICECDCGQTKPIRAASLRSGRSRSCGCNKGNRKNILHQRFGSLVAMMPTDKRDSSGGMIWLCQCDCGNSKEVSSSNLRTGHTSSCGCRGWTLSPFPVPDTMPSQTQTQ